MPLMSGIIMGGMALAGDMISSSGQASTNAANVGIAQMQDTDAMTRQVQAQGFSASQVAQQEAFQQQELGQVENYNTQMANTQMQRRVADLQAAGINPMLAVSQGGAAAPTVNPPQGASAQGAVASPGGMPTMQNANSAFGNLGGQLNSSLQAAQTAAQIDNIKADTVKTQLQSGQQIPAEVKNIQMQTGLSQLQAEQVVANTKLVNENIINAELYGHDTAYAESQTAAIQQQLAGQNLEVLKGTRDALISAASSDAQAKALSLPGLQNMSAIQQSNYGKFLNWLNATLQPVGTAIGAAKGTVMLPHNTQVTNP